MKNIFYVSLLVLSLGIFKTSEAQVSVNINIGNQPIWGPIGYDYVRYYYMPELNVYYNVTNRKYTYWKKNKWVTKSKLPKEYNRFNLFRTYKVVINDPDPWRRHSYNQNHYKRYSRNYTQVAIRDGKHRVHPSVHKSHGKGKDKKNKGRNDGYKHGKRVDYSHRR